MNRLGVGLGEKGSGGWKSKNEDYAARSVQLGVKVPSPAEAKSELAVREQNILDQMREIRQARRNLQYLPEKRELKKAAVEKTKEDFIRDQPELAADFNVRLRNSPKNEKTPA